MAYNPIDPLIPQQNPSLSNQGAFRFWVQTVLPTIYDDSLSYYELLNKVVQVLNAAISDVDALHSYVEDSIPPQNTKINEAVTKVNTIGEQFDTLQNYVADYFENLDVQDEINTKLDAMAEDGTLTELIEGILGSSTAINQAVADWLENYAETSGITAPAIDKTLSDANAAAESKTTGLVVRNLAQGIGVELPALSGDFTIGSYSLTGGITDAKSVRYNSGAFQTTTGKVWLLSVGSDYIIDKLIKTPTSASLSSTNQGEYVIRSGDMSANVPCVIVRDDNKKFLRVAIKRVDGANMTQDDVTAITNSFKRYRLVDPSLTLQGFAADAMAVGDRFTTDETFTSTNTMYVRGTLDDNSDLDNITETSIWLLNATRTYAHTPINKLTGEHFKGGWLYTNIYSGTTLYMHRSQIFMPLSAGGIYVRYYTTSGGVGSWKDWVHYQQGGEGSYIAFGDSITRGQTQAATSPVADYTIPMAISQATHLTMTNQGVSGQGYVKTASNLKAIDKIQSVDITEADLITIAYGRNDSAYTLGSATDTSGADTICGQIKACLDYIGTQNTKAQIVLIAPTPGSTGFDTATSGGWTLRQFEASLKQIAYNYHCGYADWEECSLVAHWSTYASDNTHPNATAYKYLATYISSKVANLFTNYTTL